MRFYPNGLTVLLHVCMRVRRVLDIASVRIILKRGGGLFFRREYQRERERYGPNRWSQVKSSPVCVWRKQRARLGSAVQCAGERPCS
jgi:hypothetical protein